MKKTLKFLLSLEKLEIQVRKFKNKNPGGEFLAMISLWRQLVQQVNLSSLLARKILKFLRFLLCLSKAPETLTKTRYSAVILQVLREYSAGNLFFIEALPGDYIIKTTSKD